LKYQCITYQTVNCANDLSNQVRHVADQTQQQRVQIQGVEYALNNVDKVAQPDHKLEVNINISDGDVDLLD
jgi:hypothetical protein